MKNFLLIILFSLLSCNVFSAWPWETNTVRQEMDVLKLRKMAADPSTAETDSVNLFLNADKKVVYKDDAGDVKSLGGGFGGTLSTVWTENFEEAKLTDLASGNYATILSGSATALVGTLEIADTGALNEKKSFKYTQGVSDSVNDFVCTPEKDIDVGFRKIYPQKIEFNYSYNGNDSDIEWILYDVTNSKINDISVQLNYSDSRVKRVFTAPDTMAKARICFKVLVHNASKVLVVDNVQVSSDAFPVGQSVEKQEYSIVQATSALTNRAGEIEFNLGAATIEKMGNVPFYTQDDSINTRTKFIFTRKATVNVQFSTGITTVGYLPAVTLNGVVKRIGTQAIVNGGYSSVSAQFDVKEGDFVTVGVAGNDYVLADSTTNSTIKASLSFSTQTYADNVVVDAFATVSKSMLRYKGTPSVTSNLVTFSGLQESYGNDIATSDNAVFNIVNSGFYTINTSISTSALGNVVLIKKNSTVVTASDVGTLGLGENQQGNGYVTPAAWSGWLSSGDSIRIMASGFVASAQDGLTIARTNTPPSYVKIDASNERLNSVFLSDNDNREITLNTESIPFGAVSKNGWVYGGNDSLPTNGNHYVVQRTDSIIYLDVLIRTSSPVDPIIFVYVDGVLVKGLSGNDGAQQSKKFSGILTGLLAGQKVALVSNTSFTLQSSNTLHYLNIVEQYPPTTLIANTISITNAKTNDASYETAKTINGKKVLGKIFKTVSDIGVGNTTINANIGTNLVLTNAMKTAPDEYTLPISFSYNEGLYIYVRYTPSTGRLYALVSAGTLVAGTYIEVEYLDQ